MKRLLVLLAVVAATAVLAGVYLPSNAVTVGKASVSPQSLHTDLSAIAGSADYTCFLSEQRQLAGQKAAPVKGAGTSSTGQTTSAYSTTFADNWLESMVTDRVVEAELAHDRLTVTAGDVQLGRNVLSRRMTDVLDQYAQDIDSPTPLCGGGGPTVLASLPGWFVAQQSKAEAAQAILDARSVGTGLSNSALASYYAAHRASFDRYCVSFIVLKTQAAANAAQAAIIGGTSFAQEAATASITGQTGANGGVAGCGLIIGTFLATHLANVPVNKVTVFSSQGVWWLVEATKRSAEPLSTVRKNVITSILQRGQPKVDAQLASTLKAADVTVDPLYGEAAGGTVTLIRPPLLPPASSMVSINANTPPVSASASTP